MPEAGGAIGRRAAFELLAWYSAAALFLAAYVGELGGSPAAVWPHLRIVTEGVVALAALRVAASAVLAPRPARAVSTLLALAAFATVLLLLRSRCREPALLGASHHVGPHREPWARNPAGVRDGNTGVGARRGRGIRRRRIAGARVAARTTPRLGRPARSQDRRAPRAVVALLVLAVVSLDLHEYLVTRPSTSASR
jgi:hypothetical protein